MNFGRFQFLKSKLWGDISQDIGQVLFGAMIISQILDKTPTNWLIVFAGVFFTLLSWVISVIIKES